MKKAARNNTNLIILAGVMLVNALSYGTIIPLLYPYASRFGIDPVGLSLLFASFSAAQFVATPVIGRLSDKYGRKPLLLLSLLGTSVSLALFGIAQSVVMLFVARILDGITGGNISVAQAAIADSVPESKRAQSFGILGAAFGVGFVLGPALGGILSRFGLSMPFYFASGLAFLGVLLGLVLFKETNTHRELKPSAGSLIDFSRMIDVLRSPHVGKIFWVSLLFMTATNMMIIGFQTTSVDVLGLDATQIGLLFAVYGVIQVIMQVAGIKFLMRRFGTKRDLIRASLVASAVTLAGVGLATNAIVFGVILSVFGVVSAPMGPVLAALLSERSKPEDQGGILGMNQSYTSLTQIVGPLAAGQIAALWLPLVFFGAAGLIGLGLLPASKIGVKQVEVDL